MVLGESFAFGILMGLNNLRGDDLGGADSRERVVNEVSILGVGSGTLTSTLGLGIGVGGLDDLKEDAIDLTGDNFTEGIEFFEDLKEDLMEDSEE
jgi:hypothetical protein